MRGVRLKREGKGFHTQRTNRKDNYTSGDGDEVAGGEGVSGHCLAKDNDRDYPHVNSEAVNMSGSLMCWPTNQSDSRYRASLARSWEMGVIGS